MPVVPTFAWTEPLGDIRQVPLSGLDRLAGVSVTEHVRTRIDTGPPLQTLKERHDSGVRHRRSNATIPQVDKHVVAVQLAILLEQIPRIEGHQAGEHVDHALFR